MTGKLETPNQTKMMELDMVHKRTQIFTSIIGLLLTGWIAVSIHQGRREIAELNVCFSNLEKFSEQKKKLISGIKLDPYEDRLHQRYIKNCDPDNKIPNTVENIEFAQLERRRGSRASEEGWTALGRSKSQPHYFVAKTQRTAADVSNPPKIGDIIKAATDVHLRENNNDTENDYNPAVGRVKVGECVKITEKPVFRRIQMWARVKRSECTEN